MTLSFEERIKYYQSKSLEELKLIQPKWALGKEADYILNSRIHPSENEFTIFFVNTLDFIKNAEFLEVKIDSLFNGIGSNDGRIAGILYCWDNGEFADPPEIYINNHNKLAFSDGRHRAKLTFFLQHQLIPIAVDNSEIRLINSIVTLISLDNIAN